MGAGGEAPAALEMELSELPEPEEEAAAAAIIMPALLALCIIHGYKLQIAPMRVLAEAVADRAITALEPTPQIMAEGAAGHLTMTRLG